MEPTILGDTRNGMRINRVQMFGPVTCIRPAGSGDEAHQRTSRAWNGSDR